MRSEKRIFLRLVVVCFLASFFGCVDSENRGRLTMAGSAMTLDHLQKNWKDYNVSYAGVNVESVNAILFDLKSDGREITLQQNWVAVDDAAVLSDLISWIHVTKYGAPSLYSVVGPGGQFFGYLYMLPSNPEIKVVDDKTLWIGDLSERRDEKMGAL